MEFSYQIFIFFLGFLSAVVAIALFYFFFNNKKKFENNQHEDLGSIKENIRSIQQELQNFNLVQDRIENSIIKGGSKEQGDWGELVLKNILDSSGLQEPQDYETQKVYQDSDGNPQKPDVIVHMPGKRDIIIDSKVTLKSWHEYSNAKDENSKSIHFKATNFNGFEYGVSYSQRAQRSMFLDDGETTAETPGAELSFHFNKEIYSNNNFIINITFEYLNNISSKIDYCIILLDTDLEF